MISFFTKAGALAGRFRSGAAALACDMRWSYVPPLMVYFAAGVAGVGGWLATALSYEAMYWISLAIPLTSVLGVLLAAGMRRRSRLAGALMAEASPADVPALNAHILGAGAAFAVLSLLLGLGRVPYNEEIISWWSFFRCTAP